MPRIDAPARLVSQMLAGAAERLAPSERHRAPLEVEPLGPVKGDWILGRVQQLRCEPGDHLWGRAAVRGRKPTACPEHRAEQAPVWPLRLAWPSRQLRVSGSGLPEAWQRLSFHD